ncbi:hypothetical protein N0V88_005757 [Collariella sp. IMI 366227]|nr:hypothetical protein N0V88_005757 [Collariella sp. IMI 366227]
MATKQTPSANTTDAQGQGPRDEHQLAEQLAQLDELHLQATQATYIAFKQAVDDTNKEITSFREAVVGPTSKDIFKAASASQTAKPKGIKQWRARDDPDWANPTLKRRRLS